MREAREVDVRDSGSSTRLAIRSDENNDRLGVQPRQRIWKRLLCKGWKKTFETKVTMVGEDDDLAKEARVLNRIVKWHRAKGSHTSLTPGTRK